MVLAYPFGLCCYTPLRIEVGSDENRARGNCAAASDPLPSMPRVAYRDAVDKFTPCRKSGGEMARVTFTSTPYTEIVHDRNVRMDGPYYAGNSSTISSPCGYEDYRRSLMTCLAKVKTTRSQWDDYVKTGDALKELRERFVACHRKGHRLIFIGNGGSAAIASHMAVDYTKNGGMRSIALNDAPTLTCLANDFGYENVFAKQIEYHAKKHDIAVIISSSGKSPNILNAMQAARKKGCFVVTLSGMNPNNRLRRLGDLNFYVPSTDYGLVEVTHLSLLHAIVSVHNWHKTSVKVIEVK